MKTDAYALKQIDRPNFKSLLPFCLLFNQRIILKLLLPIYCFSSFIG